MSLDLGAKPQNQAPTAHLMKVPGHIGGLHWTHHEGQRDRGAQLQVRGLLGGYRQYHIGIVLLRGRDHGIVAELLPPL